MIEQLKAKLEEKRIYNDSNYCSGYNDAVSILMPVILCLEEQRNDQASYREDIRINGALAEINEMNQEILKLLEQK